MEITFHYIKLEPPIFSSSIGYLELALIHPIAGYLNDHRKEITLKFPVDIEKSNFDGSWTPSEAKLWDALSRQAYSALKEKVSTESNWRTVAHGVVDYLEKRKVTLLLLSTIAVLMLRK